YSVPAPSAGHQRSRTFPEGGGQEAVHLLIFDETELAQDRHADETASQFLDGKKLVDQLEDASVVAFRRIDVREGIAVFGFRTLPSFVRQDFRILGEVEATQIQSRIIADNS